MQIKAFVVINPVSGQGDLQAAQRKIAQYLADCQWMFEIYETTGQEKLAPIVRDRVAQGCNLVIVAGGDGTISEVADGLIGTNVPIGILPGGTGNVFAQALNIPMTLEKALHIVGGMSKQQIDMLQVNDKAFLLNISIGVSATVIANTSRQDKRRFGRLAYVWSGVMRLFGFKAHRFYLNIDGEQEKVKAQELAIVNVGQLGIATLKWGPDIEHTDGEADLVLLRAKTLLDYLSLGFAFLIGRQRNSRPIRYIRINRAVEISTKRPMDVQGDGDVIGQTPIRVEVLPQAVTVITP